MITDKKSILTKSIILSGLISVSFFSSCTKEIPNPVKDSLRTYIQENYLDVSEVDNFDVSSVEFYEVGLGKKTYTGARIEFNRNPPIGYTTFVLSDNPNLDLDQAILQFEKNQAEWNYQTYELDLISDTSGKTCLILIQDK